MITHEEQQKIWDEEHKNPQVLKQMDISNPSSGVVKFWEFLKEKNINNFTGVEMGCGKGRNVIWLAQQGVTEMHGFDFSPNAIVEANKRSKEAKINSTIFSVQDATKHWNYDSNYFNFGIDCFASTDIESKRGREEAIAEMYRVIKPGGYLLAYLLSIDDEFHKEMIAKATGEEPNAFRHESTGKFEKAFNEKEILDLYKNFKIIKTLIFLIKSI